MRWKYNLHTLVGSDLVRLAVLTSVSDLLDDFVLTQSLCTLSGGLFRLRGVVSSLSSSSAVGCCMVVVSAGVTAWVRLAGELYRLKSSSRI